MTVPATELEFYKEAIRPQSMLSVMVPDQQAQSVRQLIEEHPPSIFMNCRQTKAAALEQGMPLSFTQLSDNSTDLFQLCGIGNCWILAHRRMQFVFWTQGTRNEALSG